MQSDIEKDIYQLYVLYNKLARWSQKTSEYINNHEVRLQNLQNLSPRQNSVIRPVTSVRQSSPRSSSRSSPPRIFSPKRGGKSRKKRTRKRNRKKTK